MKYNLFVDESCYLEHDKIPVMCTGYIKVPQLSYETLKEKFEGLKAEYKIKAEIKWRNFSSVKMPFYKSLIDFFFSTPLEFRCVLVKYKDRLNHNDFNSGSHDNFYYKMAYYLLRPNPPGQEYRVFMDIQNTHGKQKLKKLEEVFENYHHGESPFIHFQHLRSNDNIFFELTDLFIGAITYKTRGIKNKSKAYYSKIEFINYLEKKSGFSLNEGTPQWEGKFNIFDHQPKNIS